MVSAVDGLGLPTAVACFRWISCAVIMPFLFSLAFEAQEILYVINLTEGNFLHPPMPVSED